MAKKKSALDAMKEGSFNPQKAATEAKKDITPGDKKTENLPRKMIRVAPEVHAMAKKAGALSGQHMQTYIEQLIHKDFKARYPELWLQTMERIKDKFPDHYAEVMAVAKHW